MLCRGSLFYQQERCHEALATDSSECVLFISTSACPPSGGVLQGCAHLELTAAMPAASCLTKALHLTPENGAAARRLQEAVRIP